MQGFAQLVEQAGVLNCDHGLAREVFDERDLLVVERANLLTKDADDSNEFVLLEHRDNDVGPNAAKLDCVHGRRIASGVSSRRYEISSVKHSLGPNHLAKRIAVAGIDDVSASACFGKGGRHIVCGDRAKPASFIYKEGTKLGLTEPGRVRQDCRKHRLQLPW